MNYYVVLIVTYKDTEKADKVGIYKSETKDSCIKSFYNYMSQYTDADGVASVNAVAKDNLGGIYQSATWVPSEEETEEVTEA